tara:strand:- start:66 stop:995 length:930 start_codon:yes stop_codon:yes gene_type:complete
MALKFRPGKRKGELKRTTIDPRIGGTKGDAGFGGAPTKRKRKRDDVSPRIGTGRGTDDAGPVGQMRRANRAALKKLEAEGQLAGGPGKIQTTQKSKRNDVSPRIGTGKGSDDAGPVGQEARRKKAKVNKLGLIPARKLAKGEGKIRKSDIMGGSKGRKSGAAGPLGGAKSSPKVKKVGTAGGTKKKIDLRKRNLAGNKFGQRKAGGQIKKMRGGGMLGDLNKDGNMSSYEKKRQSAIEESMAKGNKGNTTTKKMYGGGMTKKKMYGGGMAKKKMMGGGMTKKMYNHGGTVGKSKKCPRDGIAMRGKTRA